MLTTSSYQALRASQTVAGLSLLLGDVVEAKVWVRRQTAVVGYTEVHVCIARAATEDEAIELASSRLLEDFSRLVSEMEIRDLCRRRFPVDLVFCRREGEVCVRDARCPGGRTGAGATPAQAFAAMTRRRKGRWWPHLA